MNANDNESVALWHIRYYSQSATRPRMPLPRCELGAGQAAYPGRWTAHSRVPPYSLNSTVWAQLGMNEIRDAKCRPQYDWGVVQRRGSCSIGIQQSASFCLLIVKMCADAAYLASRRSLLATRRQLSSSRPFVLLLGGAFGRNRVRGSTMVMVTASACNDEVRLSFVRSDLLLWTHDQTETKAVARCDAILFNYRWAQQAILDADVLVLGIGQHFSSKIYHAPPKLQHKVYAFFTGNLNRTLSSLRTLRASHGRNDPSSVVVVGASLPMPRCERVARPMTLTEAMASEAAGATMHAYGPSYWHSMRLNQLAQWVARDKGASFLDLATLSIMRGDDSLVRGRNEAPSPTVVTRRQTACTIVCPGLWTHSLSFCTICSSDAQPTSPPQPAVANRYVASSARQIGSPSAARRDGLRRATERAITRSLRALLLILRIHGGHGARAITARCISKGANGLTSCKRSHSITIRPLPSIVSGSSR